jgi:peptidoglycan/xylan/chitin deacetylase (PgdA/CDA1 family)
VEIKMNRNPVPVVMYHTVGIPNRKWQWNHLTIPYKVFEDQLKWIKNKGFNSITLQQLYDYMKLGTDLPNNPIVLTFDDGYLDNWVFAHPLLKKYGFKGVIYVNPEFVDPRNIIRDNLESVWEGNAKMDELETIGYLSWQEMMKMENEGIIDIQSHSMTHTWYPTGSKIIDFRHPGDSYIWMTWNNHPEKKPFLHLDDDKLVNPGEPVYESSRAIGAKRYFPDENLKEHLIDYVKKEGGSDFCRTRKWREKLFEIANRYKEENQIDERFESEKEYEERIYWELQKSKDIIENKLNKDVNFLCWPGGAITGKALEISKDVGYYSSTAAKDIADKRRFLRNKYGEDPFRINRFGTSLYWDRVESAESKIKYKNGFYFVLYLDYYQGKKIVAPLIRVTLAGINIVHRMFYKFIDLLHFTS